MVYKNSPSSWPIMSHHTHSTTHYSKDADEDIHGNEHVDSDKQNLSHRVITIFYMNHTVTHTFRSMSSLLVVHWRLYFWLHAFSVSRSEMTHPVDSE